MLLLLPSNQEKNESVVCGVTNPFSPSLLISHEREDAESTQRGVGSKTAAKPVLLPLGRREYNNTLVAGGPAARTVCVSPITKSCSQWMQSSCMPFVFCAGNSTERSSQARTTIFIPKQGPSEPELNNRDFDFAINGG